MPSYVHFEGLEVSTVVFLKI